MEQLSLFDFEEIGVDDNHMIRFSSELEEELKRTMGRALVEFYTTEGDEDGDITA